MPTNKQNRNAKGGGMIRQRTDGRWEARYTAGRDPGTGKQIQKSVYGKTQGEVRKKLQRICTQIDDGTYSEPSKMKLREWLGIWLSDYLGAVKPYTAQSYTTNVNRHIVPALGNVKLTELNAVMIQKMINNIHKPKDEGGKGLSAKTVKNINGTLHRALEQAELLGFIRSNPANACKLPRCEKPDIKPLQDDEVSAFLTAINSHSLRILFTVDLFTGMRQGELLGMTWDCIDFQAGAIQIYRQLQQRQQRGDFGYYFSSLKNDKPRSIVPASFVMQLLKEQRTKQLEA